MKYRFVLVAVISLGCATESTDPQSGFGNPVTGGGAAGMSAAGTPASGGTQSTSTGGTSAGTSVLPDGGSLAAAGTFSNAGTFSAAGTLAVGGSSAGMGGASAGAGGKAGSGTGGTGTSGAAGMPATGGAGSGTGGTGTVTPYCDDQPKTALPFVVNDGYQPSGWQGDYTAISVPTVQPDACAARPANAVGVCSVWRYTPNAVTPAWAGVAWSRVWDVQYTHEPICLAAGATKVVFQARGAVGGEQVTFSGAGGAEVPFTLTNAWKQYEISLVGVVYNTPEEGLPAAFFWKVAPPTPNGSAVTFFVDDIKIIK